MAALSQVVWIGGAQWAGKTSVAQTLAVRFGLIHYSYDYHGVRSHLERARREPLRFPRYAAIARRVDDGTFAETWVTRTPTELAEEARATFIERFDMVLEELARLPEGATVVAEGFGLRPELIAPVADHPQRAVFLVPSEAFRQRQIETLPRAMHLRANVSDRERGQAHRLARDEILAAEVVEAAGRLGMPVIQVDGSRDVAGVTALVETRLRLFLPDWLY